MSSLSKDELKRAVKHASADKKRTKKAFKKSKASLLELQKLLYAAKCKDHIVFNGQKIRLKLVDAYCVETLPCHSYWTYEARDSDPVVLEVGVSATPISGRLGDERFETLAAITSVRDNGDNAFVCEETVETIHEHEMRVAAKHVDGKLVLQNVVHHSRG